MKEYINKDALLAEIERRLEALANTSAGNNREFAAIIGAQHYELINLIQFINTLEVKEVDSNVEKAWDWIKNNILSSNQQEKSLLYYEQFKKYLEE